MILHGTPPGPESSTLHRLYGGVSRTALLAAFGLAVVVSLGRQLPEVIDDTRDSGFMAWLLGTLQEFGGHAAMVLVFVALMAPAMNLAPRDGWRRAATLALALLATSSVAALVRIAMVDAFMPPQDVPATAWLWLDRFFVRFLVRYGYLAALFVLLVEFQRHALQSETRMRQAELDRLALDREMAAARLQVLQAQIEPHFLFNTLATVRRLYQTSAASGREMLDNLMRYLEVALPRMRDDTSTLAQERALIDAYLGVQKIRMGRRLSFEVDIPAALAPLAVPPMMLLTLVENALKHGLAPLPEGGVVRVEARQEGASLVLRVADSGRGFGEGTSGGGTGLANIRSRLDAMFGDRAGLELSSNLPRGLTATVRLPLVAEAA